MNNFENLEIWKLAREICNDVWFFYAKHFLGEGL